MYVKPTEGRTVPDPARGDALPPEGRPVEPSQYWHRRIADGDVVEAVPQEQAPAPAAAGAVAAQEVQTSAPAPAAASRNKKKES